MVTINKLKTTYNEIWIDEEGFLILKPLPEVEMDLDELKACFKVYDELGIGPHNKVLE